MFERGVEDAAFEPDVLDGDGPAIGLDGERSGGRQREVTVRGHEIPFGRRSFGRLGGDELEFQHSRGQHLQGLLTDCGQGEQIFGRETGVILGRGRDSEQHRQNNGEAQEVDGMSNLSQGRKDA